MILKLFMPGALGAFVAYRLLWQRVSKRRRIGGACTESDTGSSLEATDPDSLDCKCAPTFPVTCYAQVRRESDGGPAPQWLHRFSTHRRRLLASSRPAPQAGASGNSPRAARRTTAERSAS